MAEAFIEETCERVRDHAARKAALRIRGGGTKDFAPYVLMIVALMVRPYGIFGKAIIERI